ncbi:MAG TPA: aminoglycoside phosphotransferase family protein [Ktedonobacterales bacterium]|jgi:spectinomycin phosphotransferase
MREKPSIQEKDLRACLQEQYHLSAATLEFLPLGLDSRSGVYRVVSEQGTPYLLKARAGSFYEPSCLVPRSLRDQGIASVVAPLPTQRNALWTQAGEWTVIVYPFIEGETGWNPGMTDGQWRAAGTTLKQIHGAMLPAEGVPSLRKEAFDPTEYARWVRSFATQQARAEGGSRVEQALRACWVAHQPTIQAAVTSLETLADVLQRRSGPRVICHADLHPGNMIRDQTGQVFVIDWEDVMLAPKERDFLFVGEPPADGSAGEDTAPFFQGYGQTEIDWIALTYYRWERVITDLIEDAGQVFFRDDLGEESRADAVQRFSDTFAAGYQVDVAWAAAAHLPSDLSFLSRPQ